MGAGGAASGSDSGFDNTEETKKKKANVELGLGTDRMSNYSVEQSMTKGGIRIGEGGSKKTNILISPTVAEISQSNAANATTPVQEDPLYSRKKKTNAKGRSSTILTSSKGVDEGLTLGKKSLLGA